MKEDEFQGQAAAAELSTLAAKMRWAGIEPGGATANVMPAGNIVAEMEGYSYELDPSTGRLLRFRQEGDGYAVAVLGEGGSIDSFELVDLPA